jgi:hypothetical protein
VNSESTIGQCTQPANSPLIPLSSMKYLVSGSVPAIFLLRITTTSNKCENLNNWKLDLKVSEFRGISHKTGLLSAVSPFPLIKPGYSRVCFTGWFNSFDMNNWHNSLRGSLAGRKRGCIFSAKDVAKNVQERSNEGKEKQEGLIAKLNANNFCLRKLF